MTEDPLFFLWSDWCDCIDRFQFTIQNSELTNALDDGWRARPEIAAEDRGRVRAQPAVQHPRIHGPEIGFEPHVPPLFSSVGLAGKERARAIGIWASCNGLAIAAGPTVGGLLVDVAGWRSIFVLVVPVAILAMVLAMRRVPELSDPQGRRLDPGGQVLAIIALAALSFVTIEGPHWGWTSPTILALAAICVLSGALFVVWERDRPGALVPLDFFGNRVFNAALAVAGMMTFGMYAMLFLTPLYLQLVGGFSAFVVGLQLLPLSVTFVIVSQYSGALVKHFGARVMMAAAWPPWAPGCRLLDAGVDQTPNMVLIDRRAARHRRRARAQYRTGQRGGGGEPAARAFRHRLEPGQHLPHGRRHPRRRGAGRDVRGAVGGTRPEAMVAACVSPISAALWSSSPARCLRSRSSERISAGARNRPTPPTPPDS